MGKSFANDFGQLVQGVGERTQETNAIFFVDQEKVLFDKKKVIYGKIICDIKPRKQGTHRNCVTVGGKLLDFPGSLPTPNLTVTTAKYLFNRIVSKTNTKCVIVDIIFFYLNNNLTEPECIRMSLYIIPQEIIE